MGLGAEELEEYTFLGWSTNANSTSETSGTLYKPGNEYSLTGHINFLGVWKKTEYKVTYYGNGGTGAPAWNQKEHGIDLTLSSQQPTKRGYLFNGWSTTNDYSVEYIINNNLIQTDTSVWLAS